MNFLIAVFGVFAIVNCVQINFT